MRADPANTTRSRAISVSSPPHPALRATFPLGGKAFSALPKKEYPHATLRNHRHELRGLRKPCGKSRCGGAGCGIRRRKPADQLDAGRLRPPTPTPMPRHGASSAPWTPPGTARPSPPPRAKAPSSRTPKTPKLKKRLIASLCFLVPLMYVSMGHMIGLPLGSVFHGGGWHAILYAGTQLVLTLPVCWINRAFFISGWKGIKTRAPGMDTPRRPRRRRVAGLRRIRHRHDLHRPVHRQRRPGHAVPPRPLF